MSRKNGRRLATVVPFVVSLLLMPVSSASAAVNWGGESTMTYSEGSNEIVVAPSLTVTDSDFMTPGAASGTVTISSGLSSGDALSLVPTGYSGGNCITTSSFNSSTGVLSLSGNSGSCNFPNWGYWREAFRSVRFVTTADTPDTTRVIRFKSSGDSTTLSVTVSVVASAPTVPAAPSVVAGDGSATITVGQASAGLVPRSHVITSNPLGKTCVINSATGSCTITGLSNGTAYTFTDTAQRLSAVSLPSSPSASVTPTAVAIAPTTTLAASPTTTPTAATTASKIPNIGRVSKGLSISTRSVARLAKMKVPSTSRVTISVLSSSRSICRANSTRLLGLKVGSCRLKITVKPNKGKSQSRNVSLSVSK